MLDERENRRREGTRRSVTQSRYDYVMLRDSRDEGRTAHFGSGVGYGPFGAVGMKGSSLLAFGEKQRKAEVSTATVLSSEASLEKGRRFGGRSAAESVNLPVPLCP